MRAPSRERPATTLRSATVLAATLLAAGCATLEPGALRYTYVIVGVDGRPVARAITSGSACPAIAVDGVAGPMDERAAPAVVAQRPTRNAPADSKPSAFPVRTCEKLLPPGVQRATIDGRALPLPNAHPRRIVVLGDTGCRIKQDDGAFQACDDPVRWPFAAIAGAAAATAPDLVIHVGDYHYRETACPPGNAGCAGSPWGYGWDAWEADFFAPGRALLEAAPWIVVRGNHETCARAGQGWWRFLDPRPLRPDRTCDRAADDGAGNHSEPYAVPLDADGGATMQFVVFDSAIVGLAPLPPTDPMFVAYRGELERAFALAARAPDTYFLVHHPVLGFAPNPQTPAQPYPGNAALQSVLATLAPSALFPSSVQAVLSGHIHLFEAVSFATGQPPQFVIGGGGTERDAAFPSPFPAGAAPAPGAVVREIASSTQFGFATLERDGDAWTLNARTTAGERVEQCPLGRRQTTCTPGRIR
jgi:hypothetical protein